MLVNRYGNKVKQELVTLASGDFVNGWTPVTINLNDDISNYRELIIEYLRKDVNSGYIYVPVIEGRIGNRFTESETVNNNFQYVTLNVDSQTSNSITVMLTSWQNSSNNEPRTIKAIYGMQ